MVIADAESPGPLRKRPRLSLKFHKTGARDSKSPSAVKKEEDAQENKEVCNEAKTVQEVSINEDSISETSCDEKNVPAVASLENLGNTCFLNSVLQVLRFTPGFLGGLDDLYNEIVLVEKVQRDMSKEEGRSDLCQSQTCEIMKHLYKLYRSMDYREGRHAEVASSDVMSMALKPDRILNVLRELNPMFEGHLQHDAQELLRCILCYLQDASKEIKKVKTQLPPSAFPQSKACINPIMQKFLSSTKSVKKDIKSEILDVRSDEGPPQPLNLGAASKPFPKTDFLDEIEKSESAKTASSEVTIDSVEAVVPEISVKIANGNHDIVLDLDKTTGLIDFIGAKQKAESSETQCTESSSNKKSVGIKSEEKLDEPDGEPVKRRGRKPNRENIEKNSQQNKKLHREEESQYKMDEKLDTATEGKRSQQPSILSMLSGGKPCKRLGMRGASVKNQNNNSACNGYTSSDPGNIAPGLNNIDSKRKLLAAFGMKGERIQQNKNTKSPIKTCSTMSPQKIMDPRMLKRDSAEGSSSELSSKFQKLDCQNTESMTDSVTQSPKSDRQPFVKVEKCDHVCDSPKKSVSADFAEKKLSPMKKIGQSKSDALIGNAKLKLEFSDGKKSTLPESGIKHEKGVILPCAKSKKVDFVENLFMGKMMLRTKCLECEFSRERIEEFHDISVPLRKEKRSGDEDEDDEEGSDSDEDNSCLKKMMDAFTEVERLRDENKYFCDKCIRHVEAERSLHYEVLPDVLSLHLKRFSASSGLYGYMSKINDHVTIPLSLPCLRYKCPSPCSRTDHRYMLYGLVTHAGVTLTSGHYLAYVRVMGSGQSKLTSMEKARGASMSTSGQLWSPSVGKRHESSKTKYPTVPKELYEEHWLECDDETIRIYSKEDFCDLLKGRGGSLLGTPYVLFYHRVGQEFHL